MRALTFVLPLLIFGAVAPAMAQNITADAPQGIADAMQRLGYRAELTTDSDGDPLIRSAASGLSFSILFYGCEGGKDCTSIQLYLGLDIEKAVSVELMNAWNRANRFAVGSIDDEGDPLLEYDINLEFGGITARTFQDDLEMWERLMTDFAEFVGFRDGGGDDTAPDGTAPDDGSVKI